MAQHSFRFSVFGIGMGTCQGQRLGVGFGLGLGLEKNTCTYMHVVSDTNPDVGIDIHVGTCKRF